MKKLILLVLLVLMSVALVCAGFWDGPLKRQASHGTWALTHVAVRAPVVCGNCDGGGGMPACGSNTLGMTYDAGGVRYYCLWTAQSGFVWARL